MNTGLVLRSVGYQGTPIAGVRFDDQRSVIPHEAGRVESMPGVYTVGWIKRGPSGFIGTNKTCARQTVESLMADFNAGMLVQPLRSSADFNALLRSRDLQFLDRQQWQRVDWLERAWGSLDNRPRRKLTNRDHIFDLWHAQPDKASERAR